MKPATDLAPSQQGAPIPRRNDTGTVTESPVDRAKRLNRERQARWRTRQKEAKA